MIGNTKGENEKSIRIIFDKTSKESNVTIKRIEIRGVEDDKVKLNSISCDECPVVIISLTNLFAGLHQSSSRRGGLCPVPGRHDL